MEKICLGVPLLILTIDKALKVKANSFSLTLQREVALIIPDQSGNAKSHYRRKSPLHEERTVPSAVTLHGKMQIWMLKDRRGFIINRDSHVPILEIITSKHRNDAICASSPNRQLTLPVRPTHTFALRLLLPPTIINRVRRDWSPPEPARFQ